MIWFIASIPLMVLAVAIAMLPVLLAIRAGRRELSVTATHQPRPATVRYDYDVRSPVRSAA